MIRLITEIITYGACAIAFVFGLIFTVSGAFYPVISEIGPEVAISGGIKLTIMSLAAAIAILFVSKAIDALDAIKESSKHV